MERGTVLAVFPPEFESKALQIAFCLLEDTALQGNEVIFGSAGQPVKGGVKVDQCGGAKGSHFVSEKHCGLAGAKGSGA
jgi:hypothetical protein